MKKTNKKIVSLMIAVLMILSSLPLAGLVAFAETSDDEKAKQYLQEIFDLLPDEISLNFPETEYKKAESEVEKQVREILRENGINIGEPDTFEPDKFYIGTETDSIYSCDREEFLTCTVTVTDYYYESASKDISLKYSNSDDYDQANEQEIEEFVSKLELIDIENYSDLIDIENYDRDNLEGFIGEYCGQLADGYSFDLIYEGCVGGGRDTGFRGSGDYAFEIFKDNVFYGGIIIYLPWLYEVITVPDSVSESELKDVLPKYAGWDWDIIITKTEKGALIDDYSIYYQLSRPILINIPDGYTIYFTETDENGKVYEGKDYVIIKWEAGTDVPADDNVTTDKTPDNSEADKSTTEAPTTNKPTTEKATEAEKTTAQNTAEKNDVEKSPSTGAANGFLVLTAMALTCGAVIFVKKKEQD